MSDTLSETKACELLARLFRVRGYAVARNVTFREYGVEFHADGWDAEARVGFEFLTSEDDDHDDLTLAEYQTLMAAQQRGELAMFVIDEVEPLSAAELTASAEEFLDEVAAARRGAKRPRGRAVAVGKKSTARRGRPAAAGVKVAGRKAAGPAAKKAAKKTAKKPKRAGPAKPRAAAKKPRASRPAKQR